MFQDVGAVQRVALRGNIACVGDDAAKLGFIRAVADACRVHNIFFDQYAAHVIGAELQSDLADFDSGREPARLNVVDVVEVQPADRERLQIIKGRRLGDFLPQWSIFRRKNPGNECGEAARVFLNPAQQLEMVHAVPRFLAAAEHHGRRRAHSQ